MFEIGRTLIVKELGCLRRSEIIRLDGKLDVRESLRRVTTRTITTKRLNIIRIRKVERELERPGATQPDPRVQLRIGDYTRPSRVQPRFCRKSSSMPGPGDMANHWATTRRHRETGTRRAKRYGDCHFADSSR